MELNRTALWLVPVLLVVSFLSTNMERGEAAAAEAGGRIIISTNWSNTSSSVGCNATMNAPCSEEEEEEEEEFLMDSESNTRLLAATSSNTLVYRGLQPPIICNAQRYGSCIGDALYGGKARPCDLNNRCARGSS